MRSHEIEVMGKPGDGVGFVLFEAPALDLLARTAQQWASQHQAYQAVSFSYNRETRWADRASLAGPAEVVVYTGVLLVRPAEKPESQHAGGASIALME